ncbi:MAG: DUF3883 domain-containing protein [Chthoniobacterales bacterium]
MDQRDARILCGLLLSKYGDEAVESLGFDSYAEAYNVLGSALDAPPMTIKNYRDELDPYFPNQRKGWHQRTLRKHTADVLAQYGALPLADLSGMVKTLFDPVADIPDIPEPEELEEPSNQTAFAKRLITGRAAEGFFRTNYREREELASGILVDTTSFGCGFDFRVNFPNSEAFCAVEVKGMFEDAGPIMLTDKEHRRAAQLGDRYFLYVVRGFRETPFASIWRNPLESDLKWELLSRQLTVTSWRSTI